jgi:hypothetical protein
MPRRRRRTTAVGGYPVESIAPIVSNLDPGGYIASAYRRKRQRTVQMRLRLLIVMTCFSMSFLMW